MWAFYTMKTTTNVIILSILLLMAGGCAQQEIQRPVSLKNYNKAYVSVETSAPEALNDIATLQNLIIGELNNRGMYQSRAMRGVKSTADGLVVRVNILKLHRFNGGHGIDASPDFFMSGSDGIDIGQEFSKSKVIARVTLEDGENGNILSSFPLSGDSPRMDYKGIDWRWGSLHYSLLDFARQLADVFPPSQPQ